MKCWWMMNINEYHIFQFWYFFFDHCFVDLKTSQEMHSRESARVVRQILPAAQGIVARHAAPRFLEHFKANRWGKAPRNSYHQLLFFDGSAMKKSAHEWDPGQSHGDSTSFGAICGLCLVANVNV